jgi:hypothetical protein
MGFLPGVVDTLLAGLVRNDAAAHSNSFAELLENGLRRFKINRHEPILNQCT